MVIGFSDVPDDLWQDSMAMQEHGYIHSSDYEHPIEIPILNSSLPEH